ncbi:MAG: alpha/beta fold hydrolase, partial [Mycobacteriales bacterium]
LYELNLKAKADAGEATGILTETEAALEQERFTSTSLASLLGMARALMAEPDRTAELAATRLPCFVCCGEADNGWSIEQQRAMAAALGTTLITIAGAAHSPCLEQPAATTAQLLRLWQKLR